MIPNPGGFFRRGFCIKKTTRYTSGSMKPMAVSKKSLLRQESGPPTAQSYVTGILHYGINDTLDYSRKRIQIANRIYGGARMWKQEEIVCGAKPYASDIVLTRLTRHARNRGLRPSSDNHRLRRWMCFSENHSHSPRKYGFLIDSRGVPVLK